MMCVSCKFLFIRVSVLWAMATLLFPSHVKASQSSQQRQLSETLCGGQNSEPMQCYAHHNAVEAQPWCQVTPTNMMSCLLKKPDDGSTIKIMKATSHRVWSSKSIWRPSPTRRFTKSTSQPALIDVMHWSCHQVTSVVQMGLIMIVCNDVMICMDHVLRWPQVMIDTLLMVVVDIFIIVHTVDIVQKRITICLIVL